MFLAKPLACVSLGVALVLVAHTAWSGVDPEDQKLIDAASCPELVREYGNYARAETEAAAQIRQSNARHRGGQRRRSCRLCCVGLWFFHLGQQRGRRGKLGR